MVTGSARNVFETKPPSVAAAHTAKNSTKKPMPNAMRKLGATGTRGFIEFGRHPGLDPGSMARSLHGLRIEPAMTKGLLDEARVGQLAQVGNGLDDARFQQQVRRFLGE